MSRHYARWLLGALPIAALEVTHAVGTGGVHIPLEEIAPLAPAGYHTVVEWTLLVAAPLFVGGAVSLVASMLTSLRGGRPVQVVWLLGLEVLLVVSGTGVAGVALAALLALLAVSVAQAGSLILAESPTAGIAAGLALAGAMVIVPAAAISGVAVACTLVAAVARRGKLGAGLAFAAVIGFPPLVLIVASPFVDWRLAGNVAALRAFLAAGWPGPALVATALLVGAVAVALGALVPARFLPVALAVAVASGSVGGGMTLLICAATGIAALGALAPWWSAALAGEGRVRLASPSVLASD